MNYNNFDMLPELAFKKNPFGKGLATLEGGGGGKSESSKIQTPSFRTPEAAPAVEATSTSIAAITPEDEAARKKAALKLGAKSLEIPTTTGVKSSGSVGTGT